MRFGSRWSGVEAVRLHAVACLGDGGERGGERAQTVGQLQQTAGEDGLEHTDGVGAVGSVRHDLRQEPYAVMPHVRICAGGRRATGVPTSTQSPSGRPGGSSRLPLPGAADT